jgi:hypothetical protein
MSTEEKLSLKAFWEAVEQRLAVCSAAELRAILQAMAQETPPSGRSAFLQKLTPVEESALTAAVIIQAEDLVAEIEDFRAKLEDTMEGADAWEERPHWRGDYYDDEDSLGPYEELVTPLSNLFDQAAAAFDYGELELAQEAYESLFGILSLEDDYGRGIRAEDLTTVDLNEAGSRFLRTVYELEPLPSRPAALFEYMHAGLTHTRPMLNDLIQISPQSLPDQAQFMPAWIAFLRTQSGPDADKWLREAVRLSQGTAGLETLARTEGQQRPRAYLDWFTALAEEGQHQTVLRAAQEALQGLPADRPIRAAIADHLCSAAAQLNDPETLRGGRWQAFLAKPELSRLLDLWDAAPQDEARRQLMGQAGAYIREYLARPISPLNTPFWPGDDGLERRAVIDKTVLAHAWLLAGEVEAAYQLAVNENVLGWSSSNSQSLVVAAVLVLLSGKSTGALPPNLTQVWQGGLQSSTGGGYGGITSIQTRVKPIYAEQLRPELLNRGQQEKFLAWCLDVARRRVAAIVSGQHRKSYDKAALITVASAEVLQLRGDQPGANRFVEDIRTRFPRHSAFQAELKKALQQMRAIPR